MPPDLTTPSPRNGGEGTRKKRVIGKWWPYSNSVSDSVAMAHAMPTAAVMAFLVMMALIC